MKVKKHTIFLLISLALFLVSIIITVVDYCAAVAEMNKVLSEVNDTQMKVGLQSALLGNMFFSVGIWGAELSFVRSVYKILKHNPKGRTRIYYIISASLAFLVIAIYYIVAFNFVNS